MIDEYILNKKTIDSFCTECDGPDGYHECSSCGEEIDFQTCGDNDGLCTPCLEELVY